MQPTTTKTADFKMWSAGYIAEDGDFLIVKEYHGDDESIRDLGLPEFSDTHWEDDTCIRLYKEPNAAQYKRLAEVLDGYLEEHHYCKIEIGKDFYRVFSRYEGACESAAWEERIGDWTGRKLIDVIKYRFIEKTKKEEN